MADAEGKSSIQVIARMNRLLELLEGHAEPAGLKVLAQAAGLHPSTAHRILTALVLERLVERVEPGSYRLGLRLLELGNLVKSRLSVREQALPHMRGLHEETGETVNLSVRRDDEIVYVERTSSGRSMIRVVNIIGARAPLHVTAVGKVFLAEETRAALKAYCERTGLRAFTPATITDAAALERELAEVRRLGYARDDEEAEAGVRCLGAGIRDDDGVLVAGLSISAPADRLRPEWAGAVRATAERISAAIGWRAPR